MLSTRSAKASSLLRMLQNQKSKAADGVPGSLVSEAAPVPGDETRASKYGVVDNHIGDSDIIKSPSDPKQYR